MKINKNILNKANIILQKIEENKRMAEEVNSYIDRCIEAKICPKCSSKIDNNQITEDYCILYQCLNTKCNYYITYNEKIY